MRVLLLEDASVLARAIALFCHRARSDWVIDNVGEARVAIKLFQRRSYDVVVLDWNLPQPGPNGLECMKELRSVSPTVPVVMFTIRADLESKLAAFQAGADDYLVKGSSSEDLRELIARIEALARRSSSTPPPPPPPLNQAVASVDRAITTGRSVGLVGESGQGDVVERFVSTYRLTKRQHAVLRALFHGDPPKQAAAFLGMSEATFRTHVRQIGRRTGATNQRELLALLARTLLGLE